jgi:hypothetical protein
MGDENTDKDFIVIKQVEILLAINETIIELSKDMHCKNTGCPLRWQVDSNHGHREISKMLVGLGSWKWNCPFCGQEFRN